MIINKIQVSPILVGYGGSIAYGTNLPTSDVDIRGIYLNPPDEIIGLKEDSEQIVFDNEDTTLYSLKKMMKLLSQCNPNTIELLGLKPEHYLTVTPEGQMLLDNSNIFLSKRAIYTFGNYAKAQLNRLVNKAGRKAEEFVPNEFRSMQKMVAGNKDGVIKAAEIKMEDNEIYIKVDKYLPINDYMRLNSYISNIHNDYKNSERNSKAIEHGKINKHMMHLVRLYMMGIDILSKHEIITFREDEHDLLMSIRNGDFLVDNKPSEDFKELVEEYTRKFEEAAKATSLPDQVEFDKVNNLYKWINSEYYGWK